MPDVEHAEYIIEYLFDVGPAINTGMGIAPVGYSEIRDFRDVTKLNINSWDASMIRHLSRVYVAQFNESKSKTCPSPWSDAMPLDDRRAAVVAGFKSMARFGK